MSLHPGAAVYGSRGTYRIEKRIYEGGMGRVFLGTSTTGQKVIVKEPKLVGDQEDPIRLEKLKVEAEILRRIIHKNVVRYVDSQDKGKTFYLILEYIHGKRMKETFRKKPAEESETKLYVLTLLDILQVVHKGNIIHRDINPNNVLLRTRKDIVLIDFGAAKCGYTQILSFGHTVVGTPGWSAPEQFGGNVTPRCDIYAVGAIMFFLLTGEEPRFHMTNGVIKSPRSVNPRVSWELSNVVLKAMDLDPSKRYQLADDMAKEIQGRRIVHATPCIFCRGKKYEITKRLTIGRSSKCSVFVDDPQLYVSRQHAEIYTAAGKYWIQDTGSRNGTFVYQRGTFQPIKKYELKDGDLIALCYTNRKGPYITLSYNAGA